MYKKIAGFILLFFSFILSVYAQDKAVIIVTFGNSTTAKRKGVKQVYPERLHSKLDSVGIKNIVINAGVGSSHSGSIKDNDFAKVMHAMDRFDSSVLRHKPDWVSINFGLNDAYQDKGEKTASRIPLKDFKKNIRFYIRKIKQHGGKIILLTPNPQASAYEAFRRKKVDEYADAIRKLAKRKSVFLIDSHNIFYSWGMNRKNGIDDLFLDKLHPNDTGHELIAQAIFNIIEKQEKKNSAKKSIGR